MELLDNATVGGTGRFDIGYVGSTGGTITGNGFTLTKAGANQIELRGDASNLSIIVNAGTLAAENSDLAFGGAAGNVTVNTGGTLSTYGARTIATPVTLNSGATLSNLGSAASTWSGTITTSGSITVNPAGQTMNLTGTLAGTGAITVPCAGGTLNLSGTNTYNGGLIMSSTVNDAATTVSLPVGTALPVAAAKTIQIGNSSGTGAHSNQTFNVAGTLTLAGTNSYTGVTTVNGGTLGGTGAAGSVVTVVSGAALAPGNGVGTFLCAGLTLSSGSTLAAEINSTAVTADQVKATGAVNITGAGVSFTDLGAGTITVGTKLVLIDYTGTTLTGTFTGYAEGASVHIGTNNFSLSYVDSSRVTLTAAAAANPFATWAAAMGLDGSPGHEAGFNDDPDRDGIPNGLEWILGGNPLAGNASSLLHFSTTGAGDLVLTFNRAEESIGQATLTVEVSTDLASPWVTFATVGATSSGSVTIDTSSTPDAVTVTIPASSAAGGRLFARLKATQP